MMMIDDVVAKFRKLNPNDYLVSVQECSDAFIVTSLQKNRVNTLGCCCSDEYRKSDGHVRSYSAEDYIDETRLMVDVNLDAYFIGDEKVIAKRQLM